MPSITLKALDGIYGIARLEPSARIPEWADGNGFVSISRTEDELSIVCLLARIPGGVRQDRDWKCFKFLGPFTFGEAGIVLSVIEPLSTNGIGVFVVSTFDGDHLLVKADDADRSGTLLRLSGHQIL